VLTLPKLLVKVNWDHQQHDPVGWQHGRLLVWQFNKNPRN